jgi:hypothetical protein
MNTAADTIACPVCQTANKQRQKFCSSCGKPLAVAQQPSSATPPPADNAPSNIARAAIESLADLRGRVERDDGPGAVTFGLTWRPIKLDVPIEFVGRLWVTYDSDRMSIGHLDIKPARRSFLIQIALASAGLILLAFVPSALVSNEALFVSLFGVVGMAACLWFLVGTKQLAPRVRAAVERAAANSQPAPRGAAPAPVRVVSADPVEQLRELAAQRAAGTLSAEEFARRKAEVLTRM